MKTLFLLVPAAAILLGLGACAPRATVQTAPDTTAVPVAPATPASPSSPTVRLGEEDQEGEVSLRVGDTLEITLPANPDSGYAWEVTGDPGPTLEALGQPRFQPGGDGGGMVTLRYRAARSGQVRLTLTYQRPEAEPGPATRSLDVTVTVQ